MTTKLLTISQILNYLKNPNLTLKLQLNLITHNQPTPKNNTLNNSLNHHPTNQKITNLFFPFKIITNNFILLAMGNY